MRLSALDKLIIHKSPPTCYLVRYAGHLFLLGLPGLCVGTGGACLGSMPDTSRTPIGYE